MARVSLADLNPRYQAQAARKLLEQQKKKAPEAEPKRSKYGAQKTESKGIRFDSKAEARRYGELMTALKLGIIEDLRLQADYTLQEAFTKADGERVQAIRYRADFVYRVAACPLAAGWDIPEDIRDWKYPGETIIEDVKGCRTDVYRMKRKMMADRGYTVREVRRCRTRK